MYLLIHIINHKPPSHPSNFTVFNVGSNCCHKWVQQPLNDPCCSYRYPHSGSAACPSCWRNTEKQVKNSDSVQECPTAGKKIFCRLMLKISDQTGWNWTKTFQKNINSVQKLFVKVKQEEEKEITKLNYSAWKFRLNKTTIFHPSKVKKEKNLIIIFCRIMTPKID